MTTLTFRNVDTAAKKRRLNSKLCTSYDAIQEPTLPKRQGLPLDPVKPCGLVDNDPKSGCRER
jgi:hypothetical protein